jgi:hypothetical protein
MFSRSDVYRLRFFLLYLVGVTSPLPFIDTAVFPQTETDLCGCENCRYFERGNIQQSNWNNIWTSTDNL